MYIYIYIDMSCWILGVLLPPLLCGYPHLMESQNPAVADSVSLKAGLAQCRKVWWTRKRGQNGGLLFWRKARTSGQIKPDHAMSSTVGHTALQTTTPKGPKTIEFSGGSTTPGSDQGFHVVQLGDCGTTIIIGDTADG